MRDVQRVDDGEILVDGCDSGAERISRVPQLQWVSTLDDVAFVWSVDASEHLDERALAGAVVPQQSDHLRFVNREGDGAERFYVAERLRDADDVDEWQRCPVFGCHHQILSRVAVTTGFARYGGSSGTLAVVPLRSSATSDGMVEW